ncbi:hypothetical protein ABW286_14565 [Erwinia papayae]|uniref:Uncharacterized protein n=1 Tax=Erwinia papayae TaxID=206499 RepID=A0ABV3N3J4_9GAMM
MKVRRFNDGDEVVLLRVFFSAVRDIASGDYSAEQTEAWAAARQVIIWFENDPSPCQPFLMAGKNGVVITLTQPQTNPYSCWPGTPGQQALSRQISAIIIAG